MFNWYDASEDRFIWIASGIAVMVIIMVMGLQLIEVSGSAGIAPTPTQEVFRRGVTTAVLNKRPCPDPSYAVCKPKGTYPVGTPIVVYANTCKVFNVKYGEYCMIADSNPPIWIAAAFVRWQNKK